MAGLPGPDVSGPGTARGTVDCRPRTEIMGYLNRLYLSAAARSMRAGQQIHAVVGALEAAGIPSVLLKGPALRNGLPLHVGFVDRQR